MNSKKRSVIRILKMRLPQGQSAFLWGARKTGKSTFLKSHFPKSTYYDLLDSDLYSRWMKRPALIREEVLALPTKQLAYPIIVDEVQRIPELLNEIHWLIENSDAYFILCGSSARKLKRMGANLLGGRAWRFAFYPFVFPEIKDLDLLRALNQGLVPTHYLSLHPTRSLAAYVQDYLQHEIQAEGVVRNLPEFARFLENFAFSNGQLTNYSNIARDCGVDSKTIKSYYQILEDTLLGYFVRPFTAKRGRQVLSSTPKFYLFDVGVAGYLANRHLSDLKGPEAGHAFEHYLLMELVAYRGLKERRDEICYWRTRSGLEVDFVIGDAQVAIEVKLSQKVEKTDLRGLTSFLDDHPDAHTYVVSLDPRPRKVTLASGRTIMILPWAEFLRLLWTKKIF
jgi:predicted AAA+ superfamily ATPase